MRSSNFASTVALVAIIVVSNEEHFAIILLVQSFHMPRILFRETEPIRLHVRWL